MATKPPAPPSNKATDINPTKNSVGTVVDRKNKPTGFINTKDFIGKIILPIGSTADFTPTRLKAADDQWLM